VKTFGAAVIFGVATTLALFDPALPQAEGRGSRGRHDGNSGSDYSTEGPRDAAIVRGGGWRHDRHNGRDGWWWVVDGVWYRYPEPIYPDPARVLPVAVAQKTSPVPQGSPPAQVWYYCEMPQGYYPYVASCSVDWQQVPAAPLPPVAAAAQNFKTIPDIEHMRRSPP
jgi:hypothetical protein